MCYAVLSVIFIPAFSIEKEYFNFIPKSVRRPSVCPPVCASVRPSCKCISPLTVRPINFKLCSCIGHMMSRVLGNISCDLDPK